MAQPLLYDIKKKLTGYRYLDQAATDIHALVSNFKNLKVQDPRQFVHYNGSTEVLLCLGGTIPVKVRGNNYNIPIAIWVRKEHPYYKPIVFITPTPEMGISPSRYVNSNGNVFLPYLDEWKQGVSDLTTLTQILCATFGDFCPVYDKRLGDPARAQWQQQPQQPVRPPYPAGSHPGFPRSPQQQQPYSGGYPVPSYPTATTAMPMPYGGNYQPSPGPTSGAQPPPYPMGQQTTGGYPGMIPQPPSSSQSPSSIVPPVATGLTVGAAAGTISAADEQRHLEESRQIERQSLESAVEDKIRRAVQQVLLEAQEEMEALLKTQDQLKLGSVKINQMLQDMDDKQREVDEGIEELRTKNVELQSMVDYLKTQPEVDVDEAVKATTPLYDQILQLYAEENAVDDTIYYLGEALRKGVIELEVFLKHVRELSRQQFMARATIMKARSTAGLGQHGVPA